MNRIEILKYLLKVCYVLLTNKFTRDSNEVYNSFASFIHTLEKNNKESYNVKMGIRRRRWLRGLGK